MGTYDFVGIGFGPSNLSLAAALRDASSSDASPVRGHFFEAQPSFGWHRNMLLPSAKMQVSFLKDLVTFRNPHSRFSFVSYLHEMNRLPQFANNNDFFPTRREFHQYLEWVAGHFADSVTYGARVTGIEPICGGATAGPHDRFRITIASGKDALATTRVEAYNVVLATGLTPRMPEGSVRDDRVWHSSEFLERFGSCSSASLRRVAVVGAGQSAAEIARFCYDHAPNATISAILPSYGYSIADNTPFANRVFDPGAVDDYYFSDPLGKDRLWESHRNTNYSVVDDEVIRSLFQRQYDDEVRGVERLQIINLARVANIKRSGDETRVTIHSLARDEHFDLDVDVVVCATGYEAMGADGVLAGLDAFCPRDDRGRHRVERDYRLITTDDLTAGIYLQGGTEHTHGLTSSLLSNLATRSGEIASSLRSSRRVGSAGGDRW
ncbi:lysine N(6)-hydroxylase/L-ornithine N(5)-oxygenase family protein [Pseudonocardia sp. ICBG1122]|nr:lysine N(6)-hydroxylase/L-ornithine N(5)-oxygenase family protein [Pseudonocardia pini]